MKIFNIILISLIGLTSCSGDAYLMEDYAIGNNETEWETGVRTGLSPVIGTIL